MTSCAVQGKALLNPGRMGFHTLENRVRMPLTARGHAVLGTDFTVQGWSLLPSVTSLLISRLHRVVHVSWSDLHHSPYESAFLAQASHLTTSCCIELYLAVANMSAPLFLASAPVVTKCCSHCIGSHTVSAISKSSVRQFPLWAS